MVSNSASDDGSTEVSSSLGLFCLVPLIILELGQTEISLAIDKKRTNAKKWKDCTHTVGVKTGGSRVGGPELCV